MLVKQQKSCFFIKYNPKFRFNWVKFKWYNRYWFHHQMIVPFLKLNFWGGLNELWKELAHKNRHYRRVAFFFWNTKMINCVLSYRKHVTRYTSTTVLWYVKHILNLYLTYRYLWVRPCQCRIRSLTDPVSWIGNLLYCGRLKFGRLKFFIFLIFVS